MNRTRRGLVVVGEVAADCDMRESIEMVVVHWNFRSWAQLGDVWESNPVKKYETGLKQ